MRSRSVSQTVGRANKAAGDSLERWIEDQHTAAMAMGLIVHVEHYQPHAKMLGGRLVYVRAGVADYGLILAEGGISGAVEAKSTSAARLDRKEVKPAQARHLAACGGAGGLALLVVEFRQGGIKNRYAIPWLSIKWQVLRSAESVEEAELFSWRVPPGVCYLSRFVKPNLEVAAKVRALSPPLERRFARE